MAFDLFVDDDFFIYVNNNTGSKCTELSYIYIYRDKTSFFTNIILKPSMANVVFEV